MRISPRASLLPLGLLAALLMAAASAPVAAAASAPNARFDVTVAGTVATFTDTSTGEPATWAWDFGDGSTSVDQNPTHAYAPGKYTVTLTVTNDAGSDHTSHGVTITQPPPDRTYSRNLYSSLVRYQNPDMTSCVAASTLIMLNEVATTGRKGDGFAWTPSVALGRQRTIMRWARAHDTLEIGPGGTDPNGWRNALNQYGWGDYQDPATMTYQVLPASTQG